MIRAIFKIMGLRLWRDKGALVLAFVLPGFIFAIFAAIFANASGGDLDLRASMAVTSQAPATQLLASDLQKSNDFTLTFNDDWTLSDIRERVRLGQDDVGLVLAGDIADPSAPAIVIVSEPSRDIAATVLKGQIRQRLADQSGQSMPAIFTDISALDSDDDLSVADQSVTYYIGATAVLFLLFSAMQGAGLSLDERKTGITQRLLLGPIGTLSMLTGKFLFLSLIGFIQAAIICGVAAVFFDVPVTDHLPGLAVACLGAAALSSGLALLVASLCGSAAQMHTVSTFLVLLFSAVGGSMVPRFMMPDWLQNLGQFTPNSYVIDAVYGILARGQSMADLLPVWYVLFGGALVALILAAGISHMMRRA
ncbi:ABC transporter permease [Fretibacter rubidus]|uniref:ABC transporter permease n=1 Tax=Fretibacter rubidus TaxID=570162 RepID=UPI00352B4EE8